MRKYLLDDINEEIPGLMVGDYLFEEKKASLRGTKQSQTLQGGPANRGLLRASQ